MDLLSTRGGEPRAAECARARQKAIARAAVLRSLSTSRLRARSTSVLIDLVREPAALDSLQNDEIRLFTARVVRFVEHDHYPGAAVRQELNLSHANDDTFLIVRQRLRRRGEKVQQILARAHRRKSRV